MSYKRLIKLSKYLKKRGFDDESDYIDNLLKFKNKKEWSVDHESILEMAKTQAPSKEYIAPIESIHQINAMLMQYREELKAKLLRMIGKHTRRGEMDIEMVENTMKNLSDIICNINSMILSNKKESNNIK